MLSILILAAGTSSRMRGTDKLMLPVGGQPLIRHVVQTAIATGLPVRVTLNPAFSARRAALSDLPATLIETADHQMSASIKAGVAGLTDCAVLLLLADMPDLTGDDLATMIHAHHQTPLQILRATSAHGKPGHPVILPAALIGELAALEGDEGARKLLLHHLDITRLIALPDQHATTDLDTPEDWAVWASRRE